MCLETNNLNLPSIFGLKQIYCNPNVIPHQRHDTLVYMCRNQQPKSSFHSLGAQCYKQLQFKFNPKRWNGERSWREDRQCCVFSFPWFLFFLPYTSELLIVHLMSFCSSSSFQVQKVGQGDIFCIPQNFIQREAHERGNKGWFI